MIITRLRSHRSTKARLSDQGAGRGPPEQWRRSLLGWRSSQSECQEWKRDVGDAGADLRDGLPTPEEEVITVVPERNRTLG
jgi:hypothetical protein